MKDGCQDFYMADIIFETSVPALDLNSMPERYPVDMLPFRSFSVSNSKNGFMMACFADLFDAIYEHQSCFLRMESSRLNPL